MEKQITSHLYQRNLEYVAKPEPRLVLPRFFAADFCSRVKRWIFGTGMS